RIALGAARARVIAQMLTESALLALAGGVVGAMIAYAGLRILTVRFFGDFALMARTSLNLPSLAFAMLTSLGTALICGIAPAWQASRNDVRSSLGGSRTSRFRQSLVGVEMALGTALLASASLLLHSFLEVMRADRGYQVEHVLTVDLDLSGTRYITGPQRVA